MTRRGGPPLAVWLLLAASAGCSLDYGQEATTPADQVPLMVFQDLRQSGVRDGRLLYTLETERSEAFPNLKQMRLKRFRFQEYDSQGQSASTGEAESAVIDTGSNDATVHGSLKAYSQERGVTLHVEGGPQGGLTWKNDNRVLKTLPDTSVSLTKDDGSRINAQALTLDLGSNRLELEEGVQGTWTPEANDESTPTPPSGAVADAPR